MARHPFQKSENSSETVTAFITCFARIMTLLLHFHILRRGGLFRKTQKRTFRGDHLSLFHKFCIEETYLASQEILQAHLAGHALGTIFGVDNLPQTSIYISKKSFYSAIMARKYS